ncbi:MAG: hypothetical protein LZF86_110218 [Nitrospira sp.]|nr:MAG: hypothetical protein LZF86_110218 [Nitrospira sp.]
MRTGGLRQYSRCGKPSRMMQRIKSGRMMMAGRHQPQNTQPVQHLSHSGLHAHKDKMLTMSLNHANHILDRQRSRPIDCRHCR